MPDLGGVVREVRDEQREGDDHDAVADRAGASGRARGCGSRGGAGRAAALSSARTTTGPATGTLPRSAMTDLPIARNTALLSASLAANSGMLQLQAAVASITLVQVLGIDGLLGLGPAIVLACGALAAPFAGRAMDRVGRVPVLAAGFAIGAVGGRGRRHRLGDRERRARVHGLRPDRDRERHGAARAHGGRRHVPARAARARHRAGAVRRRVRRDPRAGGVQPAAARQAARRRRARAAVARGLGLHGRGARARADGAARPAPDRRHPPHGRAAAVDRGAAAPDRPPAGRDPGAAGRSGELRRDGRRDDADRRGGGRPPAPRGAQRVPDHRRARDRHVRAGARGGADHRPDRDAAWRCSAGCS